MAEEDDEFRSLTDPESDPDSIPMFFDRNRHICYLEMMLELIPSPYQSQEINRLTLAYFAISGLDILRALDRVDKEGVINWVLSLQAHPRDEAELSNGQFYGFHGSRSSQFQSNENGDAIPNGSHLASTYCALSILKILGYDFSLLDSTSILKSMKNLQQPDGSFMPIHSGAETDLRFVYCAAAISSMLENWSGIDKEKAKEYIINCQSYDGGFGLTPGSESHGGATYCAVASLKLMGLIEDDILSKSVSSCFINVPMLLDWSLQRQATDGGFQGRPNKATDTCYAFWVGGALKILGAHKFINYGGLRKFLFTCQSQYGGFGKIPEQLPDLYHAYYGFCAFSLLGEADLSSFCVELGITNGACTRL
ncbi:geranylgeranyl transferase type-1 subunit beta isoform X1 [Nicotiana tomentosiformis]|uniref:geranylgeranyl transferase type-1 subunit beta isoform X1 n=1 Tax=Nicotiana tomentosiformis TaxID=4098 RepID=UPI00051C7A35|nr:geranylgeranyl transferase type-1 subunit beta isoform X1 [Nicotiana tomentosiformis]